MGKQWKQCQTLFFWAPKSLQMVTATMKFKDTYSLEGKLLLFFPLALSLHSFWSYFSTDLQAAETPSALSVDERSYPTSEVRGRSQEDPMPEGRQPRGVTPRPRSGAVAESANQGSNPGLSHCRQMLYRLSHQGSPEEEGFPKSASFLHSLLKKSRR